MKYRLGLLTAMVILFCNACSDHEPSKVETEDHVWKEQKQALDKANDVNQLIQDSAAKQQQNIERQSE